MLFYLKILNVTLESWPLFAGTVIIYYYMTIFVPVNMYILYIVHI